MNVDFNITVNVKWKNKDAERIQICQRSSWKTKS